MTETDKNQKIDDIYQLISEFCDNPDNNNYLEYLHQLIQLLVEFKDQFNHVNDSNLTSSLISQFESIGINATERFKTLLTNLFEHEINNIDISDLITKKKFEYKLKGIELVSFKRYNKSLVTLLGKININRLVLRPKTPEDAEKLKSAEDVSAIVPMDEYLGIDKLPYKISIPAMLEITKWVLRSNSYEDAEEGLKTYTMIDVNDDTMRQVANTIGKLVFDNDLNNANETFKLFESAKLQFLDDKDRINGVIYIECDGAMFYTRERDENGYKWRENKLGVVFTSDSLIKWTDKKTGEKCRKVGRREYTSFVGSVETFQKLLFDCAIRNGYRKYKQTILITDGAQWIKNMKSYLFYDALHILDYFHLCENVSKFAKELYNDNVNLYKPWADEICTRLRASDYNNVLNDLRHINKNKLKKCDFNLIKYIENNIESIDYAEYEKRGWFIGSGAIESANKNVLQERLKKSGMRWNIESAQFIITLMSKLKSNLWTKDVVRLIKKIYGGFQDSLKI
jgi:hypothetical protein